MRRPCLQNHWVSLTIGFDTFYRSFNYGRSVYKKHLAMLKELLKDYQGYQQFDEQNCEKALKLLEDLEEEFNLLCEFLSSWCYRLHSENPTIDDEAGEVIDNLIETTAKEFHNQFLNYKEYEYPYLVFYKTKAIKDILVTSGFIGLFTTIMESRGNHPELQKSIYMHHILLWHAVEAGFKRIQVLTTNRVYDPNNISSRLWWSGQYHWSEQAILTEEELLELL